MNPSSNSARGVLYRLRRRALCARPLARAAVALGALIILLLAPAALIAHELHDAQLWNQSDGQNKHVKPACETCTAYASFDHALGSLYVPVVHRERYAVDFLVVQHEAPAAHFVAYRQRAPPSNKRL